MGATMLLVSTGDTVASDFPDNGWVMTRMTVVDSGGTSTPMKTMSLMQLTRGHVRVDVAAIDASMPAPPKGSYIVMDIAHGTMAAVDPETRLAMISPLNGMAGGTGAPFKAEVAGEQKYSVEDLGPGEPMLSHPTHRYRESLSYTMKITIDNQSCSIPQRDVSEVWTATDVEIPLNLQETIERSGGGVGGGQTLAALRTGKMKGFPMKIVTKSAGRGKGAPAVTTTTRVTAFTRASLDGSVFATPTGYETKDLQKMIAEMPPMPTDSAMTAQMLRIMCGGTP